MDDEPKHGCSGLSKQQELAFSHCIECVPKGSNNFFVKCDICQWSGITNDSKHMWCHYLRCSSQMGKKCIPLEELRERFPDFVAELTALYVKKNGQAPQTGGNKRKVSDDATDAPTDTPKTGHKRQRIDHLVQQRVTNEATVREAWDEVFFKSLGFSLADDPDFRHAVKMTSFCPGFKVNCAKVMRSKRLPAKDKANQEWQQQRLKRVCYLGTSIHSDGWKSKRKKKYHNFILMNPDGPFFITMHDVTGHSGRGESIADEMERVINSLPEEVQANLIIGLTDTPSANRTAWKELEARLPGTIWAGCMAHEISLLFKDFKKDIPELAETFRRGLDIIQWVNNHDDILQIFRELVAEHFKDHRRASQKAGMALYQPGDTRMALLFVALDRLKELQPVLESLVHFTGRSDGEKKLPSYEFVAQKALQAYNKQCKDPEKMHKKVRGSSTKLEDKYKTIIKNDQFWEVVTEFLDLAATPFLLLRMVDSNLPSLSKVYYCCCLVDKILRIEKAKGSVLASKMHMLFVKRWDRWHRPFHTAAYAFDPSYLKHKLTNLEVEEVESVVQRLYPEEHLTIMSQWKDFKNQSGSVFTKDVPAGQQSIWDTVDDKPAWKFWDDVPHRENSSAVRKAGLQLTARCSAASCCEFNWSDLDDIIGKKRTQLSTERIEMLARHRAVKRLKKSVMASDATQKLPTLADAIAEISKETQAAASNIPEADDDQFTDVSDCEPNSDESSSGADDDDDEEADADDEGEANAGEHGAQGHGHMSARYNESNYEVVVSNGNTDN